MRTEARAMVVVSFLTLPAMSSGADPAPSYRQPPDPIPRILDAQLPPQAVLSPDREWMLLLERPDLTPIEELSAPWLALGGFRVDPATNGPAREYSFRGMSRKRLDKRAAERVELPEGARIGNVAWSDDSRR